NGDDNLAYARRARAYEHKKDHEKALADYTKAIQIDSKNASVVNNRGIVYLNKNELTAAATDFTRAIEPSPKNSIALSNRTYVHYRLKEYDKALVDASQAIEHDPFNTQARRIGGLSLRDKGDLEGAVKVFTVGLKLNPKSADLYYYRGTTLEKIKGQL